MDLSLKTAEELQILLGERLRGQRVSRNLTQHAVAEKAGISLKSVLNLESGRGSSIETLMRVLKALDMVQSIDALAPVPTVSPLALLKKSRRPKRATGNRKGRA
jgi:transcriptional regulator with XRE-family HTH domain